MMYDVAHLQNNKHFKGKTWGWIPPSQEVYDAFHYVKEKVDPKLMLEIGFYKGHSTSYWAQTLPDARIVSCGPPHSEHVEFAPKVLERHKNVVDIFPYSSPQIWEEFYLLAGSDRRRKGETKQWRKFPFVFIDGAHWFQNVVLDTTLAVDVLGADWVMFDNHEKPEVRAGIKCHGKLKLEQVFPYQCDMYVSNDDGTETLRKMNLELALYCKV